MRTRGLLAAVVLAACVGATSAQAKPKYPFDGTYFLDHGQGQMSLSYDCPATSSAPAVHVHKTVPLAPYKIHVLSNLLEGRPLRISGIHAEAEWTARTTVSGLTTLASYTYSFSLIGPAPTVFFKETTLGHMSVGNTSCTLSGGGGRWGDRTGP